MSKIRIVDPRDIDPALREKYDVRGPRYTSYPPATHFHPEDPSAIGGRWSDRNELDDDPGIGLYLHIPFCETRCLFCACNILVGRSEEKVDAYLESLEKEMKLATGLVDASRPVREIHLGGGTPNFLNTEQVDLLLARLHEHFSIDEDAVLSVEVEPRSASADKLDAFLNNGFTRFSLGVQDLEPDVLDLVCRNQVVAEVHEVVRHVRSRGVQQINFDLIYGLPGQTLETAATTLEGVKQLRPTRIALYSYAHVPWMMKHQRVLEDRGLPSPDEKIDLFMFMSRGLVAAGYVPVGMDHFALPDDPLVKALEARTLRRTFMGYTTGRGLDTLGMGVSAISWIGSSYTQNHKDLKSWNAAIDEGEMPWNRGYLLSPEDELRRELIGELSCTQQVDLKALSQRFGADVLPQLGDSLAKLQSLEQDGLVERSADHIQVTELGRLFIRNVCMVFDQHLEGDTTARRYSRTV